LITATGRSGRSRTGTILPISRVQRKLGGAWLPLSDSRPFIDLDVASSGY
jgi:hypothetical protein